MDDITKRKLTKNEQRALAVALLSILPEKRKEQFTEDDLYQVYQNPDSVFRLLKKQS